MESWEESPKLEHQPYPLGSSLAGHYALLKALLKALLGGPGGLGDTCPQPVVVSCSASDLLLLPCSTQFQILCLQAGS